MRRARSIGLAPALTLTAGLLSACQPSSQEEHVAVLVEGTGTYSRAISTRSEFAQQFFDQGLRLTYGYYFPEAAVSFQEARKYDEHPMIYWGLALAVDVNPNSRYMGFADDPAGDGKRAIENARRLSARASEQERAR